VTEPGEIQPSYQGYRKHRLLEQRVSCTYVLADLCRRLLPRETDLATEPRQGLDAIQSQLDALPIDVRERTVRLDLERVAEPVGLLETWWEAVRSRVEPLPPGEALARVVRSKFFKVTMDEQALVRYELELELIRRVTGAPPDAIDELERRIRELSLHSTSFVHDLLSRRADSGWSDALGSTETTE
jgi:hypothetical protein